MWQDNCLEAPSRAEAEAASGMRRDTPMHLHNGAASPQQTQWALGFGLWAKGFGNMCSVQRQHPCFSLDVRPGAWPTPMHVGLAGKAGSRAMDGGGARLLERGEFLQVTA